MKPSSKAQTIIERITYATLATVSPGGQPWNSPVYCAYDDEFNIYWGSHTDSQHSQNLAANPKAFIVIYDSTVEAGEGSGVYMQVECRQLTEAHEIVATHKLLQDRRPVPYWKLEEVQGGSPVRLYKATPLKTWMNGEGEKDGVYIDTREEAAEQ